MPNLTRTIHPQSQVMFGPLADLAPDIVADTMAGAGVRALVFVDVDAAGTQGDAHIFILDDAGVERVRSLLSGLQIVQNGRG